MASIAAIAEHTVHTHAGTGIPLCMQHNDHTETGWDHKAVIFFRVLAKQVYGWFQALQEKIGKVYPCYVTIYKLV